MSVSLLGFDITRRSKTTQFVLAAAAVYVFDLSHAVLHERTFKADHFPSAWAYVALQFAAYVVLSGLELVLTQDGLPAAAEVRALLPVGLSSVLSRGLMNLSLIYGLDYTTKVLFQSSKVLPLMALGFVLQGRRYGGGDLLVALLVVGGLTAFSLADASQQASTFSLLAVGCSLGAIVTDAFKSLRQEDSAKQTNAVQVSFGSNAAGLACIVPALLLLDPHLAESVQFVARDPAVLARLLLSFTLGYASSVATICLAQISDSFTTSLVTASRRLLTIVISFALWNKTALPLHWVGGSVFMLGLLLHIWQKNKPGVHKRRGTKAGQPKAQ